MLLGLSLSSACETRFHSPGNTKFFGVTNKRQKNRTKKPQIVFISERLVVVKCQIDALKWRKLFNFCIHFHYIGNKRGHSQESLAVYQRWANANEKFIWNINSTFRFHIFSLILFISCFCEIQPFFSLFNISLHLVSFIFYIKRSAAEVDRRENRIHVNKDPRIILVLLKWCGKMMRWLRAWPSVKVSGFIYAVSFPFWAHTSTKSNESNNK